MASWFSGALLVTPNNHRTWQSFLQVFGKVKEKIVEKPKHPDLPEQMAVYCRLLRTNTCLRYGIETSLKFLCVSFTQKRNLGRPFDIINHTPTSQLCLDKLDISPDAQAGKSDPNVLISGSGFLKQERTSMLITVVTVSFPFGCLSSLGC